MSSIMPFLWFNDNAEEAANFYLSIFDDAEITSIHRTGGAGQGEDAKVMTLTIKIKGQSYTFLNGGTYYILNPAFSLLVTCENQEEADAMWDKFSEGATPLQCGWITDRFGLTWQIVPKQLFELMSLPDPAAAQRVMDAMMPMVKINIAELEAAAKG